MQQQIDKGQYLLLAQIEGGMLDLPLGLMLAGAVLHQDPTVQRRCAAAAAAQITRVEAWLQQM